MRARRARVPPALIGLVVVVGTVFCGCAATGPSPAELFYSGRPLRALEIFSRRALDYDADHALACNQEASVLLALGQWDEALASILEAHRVIEGYGGAAGREVLAIVGSESSKVYKGEPYERVMNAYYGGLLYLMRGDRDNGLAGMRNALFRDAASADPQYRGDFGPALFLLGREALRVGDEEEARRYLDPLLERFPANRFVRQPDPRANLLVFVDLGRGPEKVSAGLQGSETHYRLAGRLVEGCPVHLDGRRLGRTARIEDLYYQATTRGPREFDSVLAGKAVAREVTEKAGLGLLWAGAGGHGGKHGGILASVGGGLFLLSRLIQSRPDPRYWSCLPAEIHIFEARVAPGTHRLEITGVGREARTVTVGPKGDTVVYVRPDVVRRTEMRVRPTGHTASRDVRRES